MVLLPLGLRVEQVVLATQLTVFFLFNLGLSILLGSSSGDLAPSDVLLAPLESRGQPLEQAAQAAVVLLHILLEDAIDDLLTVDCGLVGQNLPSFGLTVELVVQHGLWDLVDLDLTNPFPLKRVSVWLADVLTLRACQEHDTLNDLRITHDSILEQVLDSVTPFLRLQELGSSDLQRLVLGLNVFELLVDRGLRHGRLTLAIFVRLNKDLVEVDRVLFVLNKLEVLDLLGDFLCHDGIVLSDGLSIGVHGLKAAITVVFESDSLL